jgi:hypothetical protein
LSRPALQFAQPTIVTRRQARGLFTRYRKAYFGGGRARRLKDYSVHFVEFTDDKLGNCPIPGGRIFIKASLPADQLPVMLIHEMAHAAATPLRGHGPARKAEMLRLYLAGAPIRDDDLDFAMNESAGFPIIDSEEAFRKQLLNLARSRLRVWKSTGGRWQDRRNVVVWLGETHA